jgi:hypothetical protein
MIDLLGEGEPRDNDAGLTALEAGRNGQTVRKEDVKSNAVLRRAWPAP